MPIFITHFFRRLLGHTDWHEHTIADRFVWRRWTRAGWETREMTDEEQRRSLDQWSIR